MKQIISRFLPDVCYTSLLTLPLALSLLLSLLSSCSKDADGDTNYVFPDKQTIDAKAGDIKTMTFTAPADNWELISEQPVWCRLTYDKQVALPSVVGNAGEVCVQIDISDDMSSFIEKSTADLTLRVGTQQQVIGTIVRADIDTYVILKQNGEVIPLGGEVKLGNSGEATITVETNFGTPDMRHSEWFDVTGSDGTYTLSLHDGVSQKYPKQASEGYLDFTMVASRAIANHEYHVSFDGMDPNTVKVTGYIYSPAGTDLSYKMSPFNWVVSADGKTMTTTRANGDVVTVKDRMTVTVDALNDDIVFAYMDGNSLKALSGGEWFHVTQNESDVSITVDALPSVVKSRGASIYAFSRAQWDTVGSSTLTDDESYNSNAVFSFVQKVASVGFEVTYYDWNTYEMMTQAVTEETGSAVLDMVRKYEPTAWDVYHVSTASIPENSYTKCKALTINALVGQNEWSAGDVSPNYRLLDLNTGEDVKDKKNYSIDPGMDTGNHWQFDVAFPASQSTPLLLVMYNPTATTVLKALVIEN